MEEYLEALQQSPLFRGMEKGRIQAAASCLGGVLRKYEKNETILRPGEAAKAAGVLLSGGASVIREDFWGNRDLIAQLAPGELFGETYACFPGLTLGVGVVAGQPAAVLFLEVGRILSPCAAACESHGQLIRNLVSVLAAKNLAMQEKLGHMSKRTTREKLLSYLSAQAGIQGAASFTIPLNRQQLADYLGVDRSAMSSELCKMRDAGLLRFSRETFTLLGQSPAGL